MALSDHSVAGTAVQDDLLSQSPEPDNVDTRVYRWILTHQSASPSAVAAGLGISVEMATTAVHRLALLRLVIREDEGPGRAHAVAPDTAMAALAAPMEEQISRLRLDLAGLRTRLNGFLPHFSQAGHATLTAVEGIQIIESDEEARAALTRAAQDCREEVIASQPGGCSSSVRAKEEAIRRDLALLARGVRMRSLYHHTARFDGPSQAYVETLSGLGGQYRTTHELFGRLIIFDQELAFIPVTDAVGATVIRQPSVVHYLYTIFEQFWSLAKPFVPAGDEGLGQVAREIDQTILRMLAAGLKDEVIARRLGLSLRTTRRHIAGIMQELGSTSRFQAGVAAAQAGLLS
jgi:DNA-binding CsgD family transcriptional regulator